MIVLDESCALRAIDGILVLWRNRRCFFIKKAFMEKIDWSFTVAHYSLKIEHCYLENLQKITQNDFLG